MKEAYVSYETAKLLKEKGFDTHCDRGWDISCYDEKHPRMFSIYFDNKDKWISAPTHQMACAWCRDKGYHIYTFKSTVASWAYEVQSLSEDWTFYFGGFKEHDEAIEAALKYSLENLI